MYTTVPHHITWTEPPQHAFLLLLLHLNITTLEEATSHFFLMCKYAEEGAAVCSLCTYLYLPPLDMGSEQLWNTWLYNG